MKYGQSKDVKLYYSISEVVELTGIPAHILRYWEQEFPMLKPRKNRAGNRVFRERDIELVKRIQHLLQVEKFSVEGAVKKLKETEIEESSEPFLESTAELSKDRSAGEMDATPPSEHPTGSHPDLIRELRKIREMLR